MAHPPWLALILALSIAPPSPAGLQQQQQQQQQQALLPSTSSRGIISAAVHTNSAGHNASARSGEPSRALSGLPSGLLMSGSSAGGVGGWRTGETGGDDLDKDDDVPHIVHDESGNPVLVPLCNRRGAPRCGRNAQGRTERVLLTRVSRVFKCCISVICFC